MAHPTNATALLPQMVALGDRLMAHSLLSNRITIHRVILRSSPGKKTILTRIELLRETPKYKSGVGAKAMNLGGDREATEVFSPIQRFGARVPVFPNFYRHVTYVASK
jgi:hypothetical protein